MDKKFKFAFASVLNVRDLGLGSEIYEGYCCSGGVYIIKYSLPWTATCSFHDVLTVIFWRGFLCQSAIVG